jgi:kinetochore protein Nuf2
MFLSFISHREDNDQLEFDSLEHLDNPDLHVGSVRVIKLYNKIKEMLNALECPKKYTFNFADLLKPDPHRTEFFLGALLNFCLDRLVTLTSSTISKIKIKKTLKYDLIVKFF